LIEDSFILFTNLTQITNNNVLKIVNKVFILFTSDSASSFAN